LLLNLGHLDIPQDTYFTYTRANVIDGNFEYAGTRAPTTSSRSSVMLLRSAEIADTRPPFARPANKGSGRVDQGINVATMIVSWTQAKGAVKYQVEWRKDDGSWIKLPVTGNNSVEVPGIYAVGPISASIVSI